MEFFFPCACTCHSGRVCNFPIQYSRRATMTTTTRASIISMRHPAQPSVNPFLCAARLGTLARADVCVYNIPSVPSFRFAKYTIKDPLDARGGGGGGGALRCAARNSCISALKFHIYYSIHISIHTRTHKQNTERRAPGETLRALERAYRFSVSVVVRQHIVYVRRSTQHSYGENMIRWATLRVGWLPACLPACRGIHKLCQYDIKSLNKYCCSPVSTTTTTTTPTR